MLTNPFTSFRAGVIYCRENLELMREMPDEAIDLIYIDPPFFSNQQYEVIFGDGGVPARLKREEGVEIELKTVPAVLL